MIGSSIPSRSQRTVFIPIPPSQATASKTPATFSFNYLIRAAEERQRDGKAEHLGRLEIDYQFNFCDLLNG